MLLRPKAVRSELLRADQMVEHLTAQIGPDATDHDGQRLFESLVLRGHLRPWPLIDACWELDSSGMAPGSKR